ncbi:TPA: hypothetical protein KK776_001673 [Campylobacter jejuni]|uniref:hypothetical protein n=1 Tax=Paenibacillus sp. USHLN196 TaxID=3081291 RepID=UPI001C13F346|nr:hypothetical protein [Campylobacter jejuni]
MQYLVLGATHYDFVNRESGERLTGVKVTYVDQPENDAAKRGYIPMSITADEELWDQITVCPGIYEFDFGMKATKVGGKPVVVLKDINLVKDVKLPSAV